MGAAFSPLPKYIILEELPLSLTGLALADLVQHGGSFWCLLTEKSPLSNLDRQHEHSFPSRARGREDDPIIPCRDGYSDGGMTVSGHPIASQGLQHTERSLLWTPGEKSLASSETHLTWDTALEVSRTQGSWVTSKDHP